MEELKPCPFCGNTQIDYWDEADGFWYCEKCGLCGPRARDKILAADRWNALPRRSDIERVELDWVLDFLEEHRICCFTEDAEEYCRSHHIFCNECPYMGREAWLKFIKEAACKN